MRRRRAHSIAGAAALLLLACGVPARAAPLCMIVSEAATGRIRHEEGDCRARVSPASTFKIALAAMAFDAGLLRGSAGPRLDFRQGDPDWGGPAWRGTVDPQSWMKHSVVWYSQRLARDLGEKRLAGYARMLGYGNADFSGDPGRDNGLERAWIGSSLKISPYEQVVFLRRLLSGRVPLAPAAVSGALSLVEVETVGPWRIHGKTGSFFPRDGNGALLRAQGHGWFAGWAQRGGETFLFARLDRDEAEQKTSAGLRTRAALIAGWEALAARHFPVPAPVKPESGWALEKCRLYTEAFVRLTSQQGKAGLGQAFLRAHDAFLESGCTDSATVCPRAPREIALANELTTMAMNFGTASTFLPFACR